MIRSLEEIIRSIFTTASMWTRSAMRGNASENDLIVVEDKVVLMAIEDFNKLPEKNARSFQEPHYIMSGACTNEGESICFEPYACDACPYNLDAEVDRRLEIGL